MSALVTATGLGVPHRLAACDLHMRGGERVALVGPNGSGKTSLLHALAGVEGATGNVKIDGLDRDRASSRQRATLLGFAPASRDLRWPIAVREMIGLSLDRPDAGRVETLMTLFELEPFADRPVDRLSTGERARVILARTLAPRPRLLLLDEPLANLDPYWVLRTLEILRDEVRDNASAALVSLHDLALLNRFDRGILIGPGGVQMDEAPAHLLADERFLAAFRLTQSPVGTLRPWADPRSSR